MILITGGAGYIGSHTCIELLNSGYEIIIVDNFSNSKKNVLDKIRQITGKNFIFIKADVCDKETMENIFLKYSIEAVIHFAGFKAVGESVIMPLTYYRNNIDAVLTICEVMQKHNVKNIVFSSSATVYTGENSSPINEDGKLGCINPYGWTKYMAEQILKDLSVSDNDWSILLLRYFNPMGAHSSGLIGEDPNGIPNNLMPYVSKVAGGELKELHVYGNDYNTPDGTGVRDYIHVVDLARGHVSAVEYVIKNTGVEAVNLGTGRGYSVLEMLRAFEKASGKTIPYVIDKRRPGDLAACFANPQKAKDVLNWQAEYDIDIMCKDAWNFQCNYNK